VNGTGTCKFGLKKRQFVLDIYADFANGDVWKFRNFAVFLTNALLLAQFHTGACLPLEETSCKDSHTDPVLAKISSDQQKAFNETADNLQRVEACYKELFREYIDAGLLTEANMKCLKKKIIDENRKNEEINGCMATQTLSFLENRFRAILRG
jgi:hypothetical protein